MKASRWVLVFWVAVIVILLVVELAEVTQLFTLPVQSIIANPIAVVTALLFTTILALVGSIFIGLYIAQRWLTPGEFTPFEEEMIRMRGDVRDLKASVDELRKAAPPAPHPPEVRP